MINPKVFFDAITSRGVGFYAGVPDSLLANFCSYVDDNGGREKHLITANEGNAIALAMGYHMSTGKIALVYMQNSGLGNCVNPLTSLSDSDVYKVPMLLLIGWRGEPGVKDEPQHIKQGRITLEQLNILDIPYWIIDADTDIDAVTDLAFENIRLRNAPVALVVRKDSFAKYKSDNKNMQASALAREAALEQLLQMCSEEDLVVATTGKTSREVFEIRVKNGQKTSDFLTVGGMGHTASIALGVAIGQPGRKVICLDGDGSLLMHMGSMPVIANYCPARFVHVLLNNGSHESVGGQATSACVVDFASLSVAVGYKKYVLADDLQSLHRAWQEIETIDGPVLVEIKIKNGSRDDLGRPSSTPEQNKQAFMACVGV